MVTGLTSPLSDYTEATSADHERLQAAEPYEEGAEEFRCNSSFVFPNSGVTSATIQLNDTHESSVSISAQKTEPRLAEMFELNSISHNDSDSYPKDDLIREWRKMGMLKINERDYEGASGFLEKALNRSELIYGREFPGREKLLRTLASVFAYQGMKERVDEILNDSALAHWQHSVVEILVSVYLEEGKWTRAIGTIDQYCEEFEGRDDVLGRLMSACSKHGGWSVAFSIFARYSRFEGRDSELEKCVSACREQCKWDEAEGFLLEKAKTVHGNELSEVLHALAEVYLEKNDLNSAQAQCQKAFEIRRKLGNKHPLFHESLYLLAKITYAVTGNSVDFDYYRSLLPAKIQGMGFTNLH